MPVVDGHCLKNLFAMKVEVWTEMPKRGWVV